MFLMNYLFDFSKLNAAFSGDAAGVLNNSKNWYKLDPTANHPGLPAIPEPPDPIPLGFNPELAVWLDLGDMDSGSILIPTSPAGADIEGNVGIRIAPDPKSTFPLPLGPGGARLTASVCFGRPAPARQPRCSPFEVSGGVAKSTFTFFDTESNRLDRLGAPASWFFPLGFIRHRPKAAEGKHRIHRYQYSVGIVVVSGGVEHHFSHDPDMDIGL